MRSSRKKAVVCLILFLAILSGVNGFLYYGLIPNTFARVGIHTMSTGDYDTVYVGSSKGATAFDPGIIDSITGKSSFNCCLASAFPLDNLYIIKQAYRTCKPERIIYEIDASYFIVEDYNTIVDPFILNAMPVSLVKAEYLLDKCAASDFRFSLFRWISHRNELQKIPENIRMKQTEAYRSYDAAAFEDANYQQNGFLNDPVIETDQKSDYHVAFSEDQVDQNQVASFRKIKEFCDTHEIELIVVQTPVSDEALEMYAEDYKVSEPFLVELMAEMDVEYINFNLVDIGFDNDLSVYKDYDGHFFGVGGQQFSRCFGEFMKKYDE